MSFGGFILTLQGRRELAKAEAGQPLSFECMAVGDGSYSASSSSIEDLVHELHRLPVLSVSRDGDKVIVEAELDSGVLENGFYFRELGLYANGILYAYDNAGKDAEYIDAAGSAVARQKRIRAVFVVSSEADVSVYVNSGLYALKKDLEAEVERAERVEGRQAFSKEQYGVCETAGDVREKTVQVPGFILEEGARVTVRFLYEDTCGGVPSLNVSGTGAKQISRDARGAVPEGTLLKHGIYGFVYDGECWALEGASCGSGVLWSGALFEGGTVSFEVPGHYVRDSHLDLVVDSFVPGNCTARTVIVSLFFDVVYDQDRGAKFPYNTIGKPVAKLCRRDVASCEDTDVILVISGAGGRYPHTYEVEASHLLTERAHEASVFTRISAYVPG